MTLRVQAVNIQNVRRRLKFDEEVIKTAVPEAISATVQQMLPTYVQQYVPRDKGELQGSLRVERQPKRLSIEFTAAHAHFVNEGIPPSPGRYVPAIGKRLVNPSKFNPNIGMHPGFKGAHYIESIERAIIEDIYQAVATVLARELNR